MNSLIQPPSEARSSLENNDNCLHSSIVRHYENCLEEFGDSAKGVDWPNEADARLRYDVMLDLIRPLDRENAKVVDYGCGLGHLLDRIRSKKELSLDYLGLDASPKFIEKAKDRFPNDSFRFHVSDILRPGNPPFEGDYWIMNGVLTEKRELSHEAMWKYAKTLLENVFTNARKGIAFNVMSTHVDWEREDLFHLALDEMTKFVVSKLSRHVVIRHDYGLYEYTVYIYREANR